ncbi:MAG: hypothetical protein NWF04_01375 [Candidatus Bathyarchaeota archaeon]|nr:hypothetical protein [Candidatus Bathyarchaeota archaeon]
MSKSKYLVFSATLLLLLSSSLGAFSLSTAHATTDVPDSTIEDMLANLGAEANTTKSVLELKGLSLLETVVALDLTKYAIASEKCVDDSYLNVVPQQNVRYMLTGDGSTLDILCTFANDDLQVMHVLESKGTQSLTASSNSELEMAKTFLNNYQTYTEDSFYNELGSMLDNLGAENAPVTSGNIKLEVNTDEDSNTFRWTYTSNGAEAPSKCVALSYKNGFLNYFLDNWALYKIGSDSINLSEEEAIDIALDNAKAFSWQTDSGDSIYEVKDFNVTNAMVWDTLFCSNLYADKARSDDPLMLYPVRHVWVSLDKFYPGNVYGIEVFVWADTKEICQIQERFSTLDPPADQVVTIEDLSSASSDLTLAVGDAQSNSMAIAWIVFPVLLAVMVGVTPLWFGKKASPKRTLGSALILLLITPMLMLPIAVVSAEPTRRATVWGSESTGLSGRKTAAEISRQQSVSQHISEYFANDGYSANNYQGSSSIKSQILYQISNNEANYDRVAVVDFDHGVGRVDYDEAHGEFHYMIEDNVGMTNWDNPDFDHLVFDMDIHNATDGNTFFAFINTCMSGRFVDTEVVPTYPAGQGFNDNGSAVSLPFAWTHKLVNWKGFGNFTTADHMSMFGYADPDNGDYCYIGFPFGSAALDQYIEDGCPKYWEWVEDFFWHALSFDMTINQALDEASLENFSEDFGDTALYNSFTAVWPIYRYNATSNQWEWQDDTGPNSTMAVYGNGNIHLYEYFVHYPYVSSGTYGSGLVSNPNGFTGAQPNSDYTLLRALNVNDQAVVIGSMGYTGANEAHGHIWAYGYSSTYTSRLRVYASYYSGSGWQLVADNILVSPGGARWIDCGTYATDFRYISLVVYRQSAGDYINNLYIDSIVVLPPIP